MPVFGGWLLALLLLCVVGALTAILSPNQRAGSIVRGFGVLAALALFGAGADVLFGPASSVVRLWSLPSVGDLVVRGDALSGFFLVVSGLVVLPVSLFAADAVPPLGLRHNVRIYAVLYFALVASIAWVLVSGDVFSFFVAWEIMSVLCYFLVAFEHEVAARRRAAYLMLAAGEVGALAAIVGVLLLAAHAGSLDFEHLRAAGAVASPGLQLAVFLLTFLGFGVKAGLVPVNLWLPRAYTAAPSAFVPLLAGATLNLGLYGILRVNADLMPVTTVVPGMIALIVGALSALLGILYAAISSDMKTLLAHSSIENAGIITVGFGAGFVFGAAGHPALAAMAFLVALYHLLNHSLYKTSLFIGTGAVEHQTGTRDLDGLGGLIRRMPWTAAAVLAGVVSIAALPPFNGFVSEWLMLQTLLRSAELSSIGVRIVFALCGAGLALTAALAVTCFAKFFAMGFLGVARSPAADAANECGRSTRAGLGILAVACLLLGVLPTYVIGVIDRAAGPLAGASGATALVPPFFDTATAHGTLPSAFVDDFRAIGAQVGQHLVPPPGLVILHRGGTDNPVVFAASPTYLVLVLAGLLGLVYLVTWLAAARRRRVDRRVCWDGGIRRLLPEMTYTATGFTNPVRVIFQAIFRPTIVEDTRETVAEHFRTAIRREIVTVHVVDQLVLVPVTTAIFGVARFFARMHHGRLNAYVMYVLLALLAAFLLFAWF